MKVAFSTACIFALLLVATIANAQFIPQQQGIAVGEPYGSMPNLLPLPGYSPMYMPNTMANPYMNQYSQPTYNFSLPTMNYSLPAYDYSMPSFSNPYSSPYDTYSSRPRDFEEEEERREREEERREEREERREEKRREREERKREEKLARERERRGEIEDESGGGNAEAGDDKPFTSNHKPPVIAAPSRPVEATRVQTPPGKGQPAKAAEAVKPVAAPATPAPAKEAKWWENDPAYQQYLKDKKAYEESQKVKAEWPPKPKPVTTVPAPQKVIESTTGKLAASAEGCLDCGSKKGALTQQIEQLREVADPREVFVLTRPPDGKVSQGVRTVINTIYQSCDAYQTLLRPDYCQDGFIGKKYCAKSHTREAGDLTAFKNPEEFFSYKVASQPGSNVMTPVKPEGPQCRDMNKTPPVFKMGGRPSITAAGGKVKLNLYNNTAASKFVTLDCSGFVSAALSAAGLNAVPNSPTAQVTTASMRSGQATCLNTVSFSPNESIKSGDIAVFAGESQHSMIFDRVGEDPFGLKDIPQPPAGTSAEAHCLAKLDFSKFDFVIAQSGLYGGRIAVSQSRAVDYIVNFGNGYMDGINLQIVHMAADACVAKLTGVSKKADRPSGAKLLRHKGSSAPGCSRATPTEVVGQSCVKGCT